MSSPSTVQFDAAPTTSSRSIIGPSERRLSLTFFPPNSGQVTLSTNPIVTFGNGIVLRAGQSPHRISRDREGDIVTQGWYAMYASPSGDGIGWIEEMLCNAYETFYG